MYPLFIALIACFLNLIITPLIIVFANRLKLFDKVDARKIHSGNIPRLGGIGIFWTSFAGIITVSAIFYLKGKHAIPPSLVAVLAGMCVVHGINLVDDLRGLSALFRFIVQMAVAAVLCYFGVCFRGIWIPGLGSVAFPFWVSWPLTILWIAGVINAMNMIDGMDGLCGGIAIIAACSYGILYLLRGETVPALYSFALVGALAGFLFYNFPPAKIFMGDSGAMFLGFMVAVLPMIGQDRGYKDVELYLGASIVLVPVFDTFAAIWRRLRQGTSIMSPDKWHLHHKLLDLGLGNRSILAIIYTVCMGMGAIAISSVYFSKGVFFLITILAWFVVMWLFFILHFLKQRKLSGKTGA